MRPPVVILPAVFLAVTACAQTLVTGYPAPSLSAFDKAVETLMSRYQLPGASLAVARNGRLVLAHGYGYADTTSKTPVQPDTLFRIGQLSRHITAAAALKLIESGKLSLQSKPFQILSALQPPPGSQPDPRLQNITIQHLLTDMGGWDPGVYDPMADVYHIAQAMGVAPPASCEVIIRYMLGRPLNYAPGTNTVQSSFGYCVLGRVIQQVSGQNYDAYVKSAVMAPIGNTRSIVGSTLFSGEAPGEATYYDYAGAKMHPSVYNSATQVPAPYGSFSMDAQAANNGWVSSSIEMLQLLGSLNGGPAPTILQNPPAGFVFYVPPSGPGYGWIDNGLLPGSAAYLRLDNVTTMCFLANGDPQQSGNLANDLESMLVAVEQSITTWPNNDLLLRLPPSGQAIDTDQQIIDISYKIGSSPPAITPVSITGPAGKLTLQASSGASWLTVQLSSGTTPATLNMQLTPQGLTPGLYSTSVNLTAAGSSASQQITVRLGVYNNTSDLIPITGSGISGSAALEQGVRSVMQQFGIPGVALGISKDGALVYARGFGFADVESQTPVQPDSVFRIGSVSKTLTASAIDKMIEAGKFGYPTPAFGLLSNISALPGATVDPRVNQITIEELQQHTAGLLPNADVGAAASALNETMPGTFEGVIRWELGQPLDFAAGTGNEYCNFCYDLLGEIVQQRGGVPYDAFVTQNVLSIVGVGKTHVSSHLKANRLPGEVTYYPPPDEPLTQTFYPADTPLYVPGPYGGFTLDWGAGSAAGAWASTCPDLLRHTAAVTLGKSPALFTNPPRSGFDFSPLPIGRGWEWDHDGGIDGTATRLEINDDVAWCILTNTTNTATSFLDALDQPIMSMINQLNKSGWPTGDLFQQFLPGLASNRATVSSVVNGASFQGGFASGGWITIFGSNLAGNTRGWGGKDFNGTLLPTALDGTSVMINGNAAYVAYISPTQINVLAPDDTTTGMVDVLVTTPNGDAVDFNAAKSMFSPALFLAGSKYVAGEHGDGSYLTTSSPAKPGETVTIFGTGFGATKPATDTSMLVTKPQVLANTVTVTVGGQNAMVTFAGVTEAGLDQINVTIPSGLADGDALVVAKVGGSSTQGNVFVTVHH
jgi:uncharacterized protein (TIGR03437 family)